MITYNLTQRCLKLRLKCLFNCTMLLVMILLFFNIHSIKEVVIQHVVISENSVYNSKETAETQLENPLKLTLHMKDNFSDLLSYMRNNKTHKVKGDKPFEYVIIDYEPDSYNPTIEELWNITLPDNATVFEKFQLNIRRWEMYQVDDPLIPELLEALVTTPVEDVEQNPHGTQFKFVLYFDGGKALAKPMRYSREQDTLPNHNYFSDFERHTAEIATFHLDRLLGFRRTAPVIGRRLNVTELEELSPEDLQETFFTSPDNNKCFYGNCTYYCNDAHAFCGKGEIIEAALLAYLPMFDDNLQKHWESPWRRSYHKRLRERWEKDSDYCEDVVKDDPIYATGSRILYVMDMVILDFLIGNQDRHHYETFKIFGNDSSVWHTDHGRGFGLPYFDDPSVLTPIIQCCTIRSSTLETLLRFHNGPKPLSQLMRESMASDPIAPILLEPNLLALDRRVKMLLETIRSCIEKKIKDIK